MSIKFRHVACLMIHLGGDMKNLKSVFGLGATSLLVSLNIGCQSQGFQPITVEERTQELQTASVFDSKIDNAEAFIAASIVVEGSGTKSRAPASIPNGNNQGAINRDAEDSDIDKTPPVVIPSTYTCSNARTKNLGSNLLSSRSLRLVVGNCIDSDPAIRNTLISSKILKTRTCNQNLRKALFDDNGKARKKVEGVQLLNDKNNDILMSLAAVGQAFKIDVLYDINQANNGSDTQENCDRRASPLFILTNKQAVHFTSPLTGIEFDILGDRNANEKRLISWTNNANLKFIALPNSAGRVEGVNELFGDNTRGPDGRFAADGFEALAKFDSNGDGYISADDHVFADLRLWHDENFDGVGEGHELQTLNQSGIEVIDLRFDRKYLEEDQWGNQIKFKSVAKTVNGELRLVFDIWFRHLPLFANFSK